MKKKQENQSCTCHHKGLPEKEVSELSVLNLGIPIESASNIP